MTGSIDEKVRHSITKLADIHFVATKGAAERIKKLGESKSLVDERTRYISGLSERLLQSISGSKRMGMAGELMLRNILDHSGLVKGKQWIENQNYKKNGKTKSRIDRNLQKKQR